MNVVDVYYLLEQGLPNAYCRRLHSQSPSPNGLSRLISPEFPAQYSRRLAGNISVGISRHPSWRERGDP